MADAESGFAGYAQERIAEVATDCANEAKAADG